MMRKPLDKICWLKADGKFSFNLKASNGQIIGTSQTYTTEQSRDAGIDSVSHNGPEAEVTDLTALAD